MVATAKRLLLKRRQQQKPAAKPAAKKSSKKNNRVEQSCIRGIISFKAPNFIIAVDVHLAIPAQPLLTIGKNDCGPCIKGVTCTAGCYMSDK